MENEQDRDAIRKAKVLYSSCMNESKALLAQSKHEEPEFVFLELFIIWYDLCRVQVKFKIEFSFNYMFHVHTESLIYHIFDDNDIIHLINTGACGGWMNKLIKHDIPLINYFFQGKKWTFNFNKACCLTEWIVEVRGRVGGDCSWSRARQGTTWTDRVYHRADL